MQTIEEKLKIGPNETVEFLTTIDEISDLAKVAVSFANNKGGSILVGVNLKGKLIGILPEPELNLVEEIHGFLEENILLKSIIHTVKHYFILEIIVSKSISPIKLKSNNASLYYYRVGNESTEANKIIAAYLDLKKFQKPIALTPEHIKILSKMEGNINLSRLYNSIDLKPKVVDSLLAELTYLDKVNILFVDKTFYYSKK